MVKMIGGPLDGCEVPNRDGYFQEGDYEAVNTYHYATPESGWSPESVYQMRDGFLVYDPQATAERKVITDLDPSQL